MDTPKKSSTYKVAMLIGIDISGFWKAKKSAKAIDARAKALDKLLISSGDLDLPAWLLKKSAKFDLKFFFVCAARILRNQRIVHLHINGCAYA